MRRHGLRVSPGTLYPLLARMEQDGLLQVVSAGNPHPSPKARREYVLTARGAKLLARLRRQVEELHHEVVDEHLERASRRRRSHGVE
ncbi:MAG TPA: PadR family transcriptional regulator [Vicinamibacterales bacterium]|nr:PadR family transcriptional regulator [Vicinamibacterales bacterium]